MSIKKYFNGACVDFKYAKGEVDIYGNMLHDYYEIYLLINGNVNMMSNKMKRMVEPYQLVIVPPGEYHQFIVEDDIVNYERYVLNIYMGFIDESILCEALDGKAVMTLSANHRIVRHFLYLGESVTEMDNTDFSYVLSAVAKDIIFIIKYTDANDDFVTEDTSCFSYDLMRYIDEHYTEPIDLKRLSQKFHRSISSLCHIFKKNFGVSIKKYILQKRLNASKRSIQNGEKPVEVSLKYGFYNYSAFYRAYQNLFGFSPSETVERKQNEK